MWTSCRRRAGLLGFVAFLFAGLIVCRSSDVGFCAGRAGPSVPAGLAGAVGTAGGEADMARTDQAGSRALGANPPCPKPARADDPLSMVELPSGEFWMGSPESEPGRYKNELRHRVKVRPFAIGNTGDAEAIPKADGRKSELLQKRNRQKESARRSVRWSK